jgi:hypothetical protein
MFEFSVITYSRILASSLYRTYASVGRPDPNPDTLHVSAVIVTHGYVIQHVFYVFRTGVFL